MEKNMDINLLKMKNGRLRKRSVLILIFKVSSEIIIIFFLSYSLENSLNSFMSALTLVISPCPYCALTYLSVITTSQYM